MRVFRGTALALVWGLLLAGCASKEKELAAVARDWALVIRASQIIPVYPLTEDLQPGDIFLVQLPVDRQHEAYTRRGFLALDNHVDRIAPTGYERFYEHSFGEPTGALPLPRRWLRPGEDGAWDGAPTASFPTYSFSVRRGGGLNLAIPVKGVPVALSVLGASSAEGTVTIADARTYGVDTRSLADDVLAWGREHIDLLARYASSEKRSNYIRVVSRVYLTGRVDVSVRSADSFSATASAGAEKPVDLLVPEPGADPEATTLEAYSSNLEKLNEMLARGLERVTVNGVDRILPGGTVRVVSASARSIALAETFERPLVIGYLGFDMAIGADGSLGAPIPTHAVLEHRLVPSAAPSRASALYSNAALTLAHANLRQLPGEATATAYLDALDRLARFVPEVYPCSIFTIDPSGELREVIEAGAPLREGGADFALVTTYRGQLLTSIDKLETAAALDDVGVEQLQAGREALDSLDAALRQEAALLRAAVDYALRF